MNRLKETSVNKQERLNCNVGRGVDSWDCYSDCAFWNGKLCINHEKEEIKKPRLRKIKEAEENIISKIEGIIAECIESDHIQAYSIENFAITELDILGDYAKDNNIFISIRAEYSNFHQGVMVQLIKRDLVNKFIEYL